ncbi:MAG: hypothetical protein ACTHOB_08625 [Ginsengibacter sp.]
MSGNNGGGFGGFGGSGGAAVFDCKAVSIKTTVVSPDPTVLATLSIGDSLTVNLRSPTGL